MINKLIHTSAQLRISPFNDVISLKFLMTKEIGNHTRISFSGQVSRIDAEKYLNISDNQTVEVYLDTKKIFLGYIESINLKQAAQDYYIEGTACSVSLELDVQKKIRTFQDENLKYEELIKTIVEENEFQLDLDAEIKGAIEFPIIQYRETDWEFLKRIASRFHKEIKVNSTQKILYIGKVERQKETIHNPVYTIEKDIKMYRNILVNEDETVTSNNYTSYNLQSETILEPGDHVNFFDSEYEVRVCKITTTGSEILGEYKIYSPEKYIIPVIKNINISGKSFRCEVLKAQGNKVKLCLTELNDEKNQEKAYLFPYATPYSSDGTTGFYIMPEIGDIVLLSFPSDREDQAIITGSVRNEASEGDKHTDPNIKYIRTKNGKEIMFDEKSIKISALDAKVHIQLIDDKGIMVYSEKDIIIQSKGNLTIASGKELTLESQKEVKIISKNAVTKMSQSGYEVKAGVQKYN